MTLLAPAPDVSAADWIVADVTTFAESVLSLLPSGFPSYVRIFHPAHARAGDDVVPIRWSQIAQKNGRRTHSGMQLRSLTGGPESHEQPGAFDFEPETGALPPELLSPLVDVLRRGTSTPDGCWFAVWFGWGGIRSDIVAAPTFDLPHRIYHLLCGPLAAVTEDVSTGGTLLVNDPSVLVEDLQTGSGWNQTPSLWWPDDHAWCVATEVGHNTSYVGCTHSCRDDILALADIEAFEIDPSTGIAGQSDLLNSSDY